MSSSINETESLPTVSSAIQQQCEPVQYLEGERDKLEDGKALCLSGGGYRAMLFHAGVLWFLNESKLLQQLNRISSVSGGSITAGVLALHWKELLFENGIASNFEDTVVKPIRNLATRTIDVSSVMTGTLWFGTIGEKIADSYRKYLFDDKTLQDMVGEVPGQSPRFVFNATNVQSGALWRFMKPYMRDYRVGEVKNPTVDLAVVVAASSAFPPLLSPVELDLDPDDFTPDSGRDLQGREFRTQIVLTDGGVYDNLGLETAWKRYRTILVSDAGGGFRAQADPDRDWLRHATRVLFTIDNQVRSLRKRQVISGFKAGVRAGAYWSIGEDLSQYQAQNPLQCPFARTTELAELDTRLKKLDQATQERLINWGYAACAWRYRQFADAAVAAPTKFPYPASGV
jgi:NTE family protein